jgi:hypothetical protein
LISDIKEPPVSFCFVITTETLQVCHNLDLETLFTAAATNTNINIFWDSISSFPVESKYFTRDARKNIGWDEYEK